MAFVTDNLTFNGGAIDRKIKKAILIHHETAIRQIKFDRRYFRSRTGDKLMKSFSFHL